MNRLHNSRCRRPSSLAAALVACALVHSAGAAIVVITDSTEWETQTGSFTTLGFTELAEGEFLTDQYAGLGVTFTGTAVGLFHGGAFPTDNYGIIGFTSKVVEAQFASPLTELAIEFASFDLEVHLYLGGEFVASAAVSQPGSGPFVGIISDTPFDRVEMLAPGLGVTLIDNIHFGAPIPAPGALGLLALAGFMGRRRR